MKLLSLTVANYRVHQQRTIDLDAPLVLIGGPNESGKSTLAEAAHRALFMGHRKGGGILDGMRPKRGGHPQVILRFEHNGSTYSLTKLFRGPQGTVTLTKEGGHTWQQAEAETMLAELLRTGNVGANNLGQLKGQWAHLWTWQGSAGDDPAGLLHGQHASLVTLLQNDGGAAVMQSPIDMRVASAVHTKYEETYGKNGAVKAGSPLGKAQQALQAAVDAMTAADHAFNVLEQAAADHAVAVADEQAARQEEILASRRLAAAKDKAASVARLVTRLRAREEIARLRRGKLDALRQTSGVLVELESQLAGMLAQQAPAEETKNTMLAALDAARADVATSAATETHGASMVVTARQEREFHDKWVDVYEKEIARAARRKQHELVVAKKAERQDVSAALAGILPADDALVQRFRDAESQLANADAALAAMATGIEVVEAGMNVRIDGKPVAAGNSEVLTGVAEIHVGDAVVLRIRPGGGNALADARAKRTDASVRIGNLCAAHGINSSIDAGNFQRQRQVLENRIATIDAHLDGLGANQSGDLLAEADNAVTAARTLAEQLGQSLPDHPVPGNLVSARGARDDATSRLAAAELSCTEARSALGLARAEESNRQSALAGHEKMMQDNALAITGTRAQIATHLGNHGDRAGLDQAIAVATVRGSRADDCVARTRKMLGAMQPAMVELDEEQAQAAKDVAARRISDATTRKQIALAALRNDGTLDPSARRTEASENLRRAQASLDHLKQRADAIYLLDQTIAGEREALATRYTGPLANKIKEYLSCLFGPDCRVNVQVNDDHSGFAQFSVVRPIDGAGEMAFEDLSGGAREQVEAAIRLAAAEVLAAEHGGCLPVIFDDAFAFTDSTRVEGVQRMLFRASKQGLQIIVLACNPQDYAGLGARIENISRQADHAPATIRDAQASTEV